MGVSGGCESALASALILFMQFVQLFKDLAFSSSFLQVIGFNFILFDLEIRNIDENASIKFVSFRLSYLNREIKLIKYVFMVTNKISAISLLILLFDLFHYCFTYIVYVMCFPIELSFYKFGADSSNLIYFIFILSTSKSLTCILLGTCACSLTQIKFKL